MPASIPRTRGLDQKICGAAAGGRASHQQAVPGNGVVGDELVIVAGHAAPAAISPPRSPCERCDRG
jgi:hypothetical protein